VASDARKLHWESVYDTREPTEVSWYQAAAARSLELVRATGEPRTAAILDVGGGASTLVDDLLASGYSDVTVLDLAANALDRARARLGESATRVEWVEADVTHFRPQREYAIWHDRAVFHFLTGEEERVRYLEVLREALRPRGHFILATFGPQGPRRCSGLDVRRYAVEDLTTLLGPGFELRRHLLEDHRTPAGVSQQFLYGWWQATG